MLPNIAQVNLKRFSSLKEIHKAHPTSKGDCQFAPLDFQLITHLQIYIKLF